MADRPPLSTFVKTERPPLESFVKKEDKRTPSQKVAEFLGLGNTWNTIGTVASTPVLNKHVDNFGKYSQEAYKQSNELIKKAKSEKDPIKKQALLDQSRAIMNDLNNKSEVFSENAASLQQNMGIGDREMAMSNEELALRRGAGTAAELAAWMLPGKMVSGGATAGVRIANAAKQGAVSGALQGAAGATKSADNLGEAALSTAGGAVVGAGTSALLASAGEGAKAIAEKFRKTKVYSDLSARINETRRIARESEFSARDTLRGTQFTKYKNKHNKLINETEVARVLDDLNVKYDSPYSLRSNAKTLGKAVEDIKVHSLKSSGGKVDLGDIGTIYMREAKHASLKKPEVKKIFDGIIEDVADNQNLAGADPVKANEVARRLGSKARQYYKIAQGDTMAAPDAQYIYEGLTNARRHILEQIDEKFADSITFTPDQIARVQQISPDLAQSISDKALSMADINYIQAMMYGARDLSDDTIQAIAGAGRSVMKTGINLPVVSEVADTLDQALEVATTPMKGWLRTNTAKGMANAPDLFSNLISAAGSGANKVAQAGLKAKPAIINPAVAALQRAIDKENKFKTSKPMLP